MKKTTLLLRDAIVVIALFFISYFSYSQATQTVDLIAAKDTYIKGKIRR